MKVANKLEMFTTYWQHIATYLTEISKKIDNFNSKNKILNKPCFFLVYF